MKRIIPILILILLFSLKSNSQSWPKFYHYPDQSTTSSACAVETYDNGFAILSNLGGFPYPVVAGWLIKTDINGDVLWTRTLGNKESYYSACRSMQATADSGFIITMNTGYRENSPFGGTKDAGFLKLNSCGQVDWCNIFNLPDIQNNSSFITQTKDGYIGLMKVGNQPNSLVKFNFNGQIQWMLEYDHPEMESESFNDIIELADSSLLISGCGSYTISQYESYIKPLRLNISPNGNIINFQILYLDNDSVSGADDNQTIESTSGRLFTAGTTSLSWQSMRKHSLNELNPVNYQFGIMSNSHSLCWLENNTIAISGSSSTPGTGQGIFDVSIIDTLGNLISRRELTNHTMNSCQLRLINTHNNKILATGTNSYFNDEF